MSSTRVFLEIVLRILVEVIEAGVRVERVSDFRHVEGVPYLAEEGVRGNANSIAVCDLQSILSVVSDGVDLV